MFLRMFFFKFCAEFVPHPYARKNCTHKKELPCTVFHPVGQCHRVSLTNNYIYQATDIVVVHFSG